MLRYFHDLIVALPSSSYDHLGRLPATHENRALAVQDQFLLIRMNSILDVCVCAGWLPASADAAGA